MVWLKTRAFLAIFMAVFPVMRGQLSRPPPLCASQLALASHACAFLPLSPPEPPAPAPSPPSPPDDDNRHRRRSRRQRRHARRHHRNRDEMEVEDDCCRWIKEVDSECVCDLLVRLPAFLSRPMHQYNVSVSESCTVTYSCPGRLKI